jgi:hypothetical protein
MRAATRAPIAVAAAVAVAACGSTVKNTAKSSPATGAAAIAPQSATSSPSAPTFGQTYLAIITPANQAAQAFSRKVATWTDATKSSQAEADAQPLIAALHTTQDKLLAVTWPESARSDIRAVISDVGPIVRDLQDLFHVNAFNASSWESIFERDFSVLSTASELVRYDLGHPAATG